MTAFTSTRAGALYVLGAYNIALANNGQDLQASLETLMPLLDADRYDDLVAYVSDMVNQYAEVNGVSDDADEQFEAEANAIAGYLQNHARPKLIMS